MGPGDDAATITEKVQTTLQITDPEKLPNLSQAVEQNIRWENVHDADESTRFVIK